MFVYISFMFFFYIFQFAINIAFRYVNDASRYYRIKNVHFVLLDVSKGLTWYSQRKILLNRLKQIDHFNLYYIHFLSLFYTAVRFSSFA